MISNDEFALFCGCLGNWFLFSIRSIVLVRFLLLHSHLSSGVIVVIVIVRVPSQPSSHVFTQEFLSVFLVEIHQLE